MDKKIIIVAVVLIVGLLIILNSSSDKIVATMEEDGTKQTVEFEFDKGALKYVKMIMEFPEKDLAEDVYNMLETTYLNYGDDETIVVDKENKVITNGAGFKIKFTGKKVIMEGPPEELVVDYDSSMFEGKSVKEIKKELREEGWKVK